MDVLREYLQNTRWRHKKFVRAISRQSSFTFIKKWFGWKNRFALCDLTAESNNFIVGRPLEPGSLVVINIAEDNFSHFDQLRGSLGIHL